MRKYLTIDRVWDVLALVLIAFVVWKIFVAPRALGNAQTSYPAPPTHYAWLDGGNFVVREARGRLLFLDFYATWCEPCKVELPIVEAWARRHPEALVVPVDVAEPRELAAAYAKKMNLGRIALDPNGSANVMFSLQGFPTVVVIDPQNRVRTKWEGLNPAISLAMDNAEKELR